MNNINNICNISNIGNQNSQHISVDNELSNINELNIFSYNKLRKMKRKLYDSKYDNIIDTLLSRTIPKKMSKIKITNDNYFVPDTKNYNKLLQYDFKLNELKYITKIYNLKSTGNKEILLTRVYNYLDMKKNVILIQSIIRRHYVVKYIQLQGPGLKDRNKCINKNDFCTMIPITDIPNRQFISISTDTNHIYGYDIMSIYNLFIQGNNPENPFTKTKFKNDVLQRVLDFIRYSKILNIDINTNFCNLECDSLLDRLNIKAISLFHKINMLGNYTNSSWFTSLSRENLILFVKELLDIWNYRANLDERVKRDICPPYGNPFKNIIHSNINQIEYIRIKKKATNIIESMVCDGVDDESKKLGAFYVLCGLTLVNIDAANAIFFLNI